MKAMEELPKTLSVREVSEKLGVSAPTLRFWEKELEGVIVPFRTKGGQRRYTLEHLFVIDEIKRLRKKGLSLANIRKEFDQRYSSTVNSSNPQKIDLLANRVANIVKSTIHNFFEEET
jgi:DNA-binding transcriptional MerR regulator